MCKPALHRCRHMPLTAAKRLKVRHLKILQSTNKNGGKGMVDHGSRWLMDRRAVQLELSDDVLSVNMRGRFTRWRLGVVAAAVQHAMAPYDCGAVLVNVVRAQLDMAPQVLVDVWGQPLLHPLSLRFAAVIHDARERRQKWLLRSASNILGARWPGQLVELFDMGAMRSANQWADRHATMFRRVQAEREAQAVHLGRSGPARRKRIP